LHNKKILILQTGHIQPAVAADYDVLFIEGMHLPRSKFHIVDLPKGDSLPETNDFAGIIISGSSLMVTDNISWLEETAAWLRKQKNIPTLGICFGHQLLAYAWKGKVADNPHGIELGTKTLEFTQNAADDLLLDDSVPTMKAQLSHLQSVVVLPENAVLLASSRQEPHQAFRLGEKIWGIQFHPEFDVEIMQRIIRNKAEKNPGSIEAAKLLSELEPTLKSHSILRKFAQIILKNQT